MSNISSLNDTLEEELRRMLVDKNNECQGLYNKVKVLENNIAEDQLQKYKLLVEVADLKDQIKKLSAGDQV